MRPRHTPAQPHPRDLAGEDLGPYRVVARIGTGGMAVVYKGYQPSMDRWVAIKVFAPPQDADSTFEARFRQEARTIASLEHPHILPVHDYGESGDLLYLVMRLVEGGSLKDRIERRSPMGSREVLAILEELGGALGHAHERGVVHRDVKPANVLFDSSGHAFLTDFGLAFLVQAPGDFTRTGHVIGTPVYMSPEQASGEKGDARSDVYSLGVVLYEMLAGVPPFRASTVAALLMNHILEAPARPREVVPDIPEAVEEVVLLALRKSPAERFPRCEDLVSAFSEALSGTRILRRTGPEAGEPAVPAARGFARRRLALVAGAAGLLALALPLALSRFVRPEPTSKTIAPPGAVAGRPAPARGEWNVFLSGDDVRTVALQGDTIWAGGGGGIVRWNRRGEREGWITRADGLPSNRVRDLAVGPDGSLWAATESGVARLDPSSGRWKAWGPEEGLDAACSTSLAFDDRGILWAATGGGKRGLSVFESGEWRAPDAPPLPAGAVSVRSLLADGGRLWAALEGGGLALLDHGGWALFLEGLDVFEIRRAGSEILAASGHGVWRWRPGESAWEAVEGLEDFAALAILEDSLGRFWAGGPTGIRRRDPGRARPREIDSPWPVSSLVEDGERTVWAGLAGGGVARVSGDDELILWTVGGAPPGSEVRDLAEGRDGTIWVALEGGMGVCRHVPRTGAWESFREFDWPSEMATDAEGRLWLGGYETVSSFDGREWRSREVPELAGRNVMAIAGAGGGAEWFGGEDRLVQVEGGESTAHPAEGRVTQIVCLAPGRIAAVVGGRLGFFEGGEWTHPIGGEEEFHQLALGPDGRIWAAAGRKVHVSAGGASDEVSPRHLDAARIAVGRDGTVWIGGDRGLARLGPFAREWEPIVPDDERLPPEVTALLAASDGRIWVGTKAGLAVLAPR